MRVQGVSDHGILESIEMNNFMCHKLLKFNFGPQINFIIGDYRFTSAYSSIRNDLRQGITEVSDIILVNTLIS